MDHQALTALVNEQKCFIFSPSEIYLPSFKFYKEIYIKKKKLKLEKKV